jgi:hypothetical protein
MKRRNEVGELLNSEHLDDEHYTDTTKVQALSDTIGGTMPTDQSKEVMALAYERHCLEEVAKELRLTLSAAETRVQRVIQASSEVLFKTVSFQANVPAKVSAMGYNRTRLVITGNNLDVSIGTDPNIAVDGFNTSRIGYAGSYFTREVASVRDIWIVSATAGTVGVQEEFVA